MFDRSDPGYKRPLLLCYLRDIRAWGEEPLLELFDLTADQAEELLAEADRLDPDGDPADRKLGPLQADLTPREVESMQNDYARDPYMTPRQRKQALGWIAARWPTEKNAEAVELKP